jgi:U32 family peptidase
MAPRSPELLAPAGNWDALRAAAANGADAVYFGVESFNARMRAANFQVRELPAIAAWLHRRGVKAYLTLNVLVFSEELEQAGELILAAAAAGVDALIVQDIGLARLAVALAPELAVHASTQMSITSAAGVAQAVALGCRQVVLARELSLRDLQRIQAQLRDRGLAVPLEVFVHGALCVAYSGQCLTSEALGQRSANRGECAQACRLPYQMVVDGQPHHLDDQRYLLSPQDLAAWELVPQLAELGIASFKIEGRLKEASYVAVVTEAYRRSLDDWQKGQPQASLSDHERRSLELSFSRGLSSGWLAGIDHRQLVHGRWSKKRGPLIGTLQALETGGWCLLRTADVLKPGDGLVFEARGSDPLSPPQEVGGRVMAVHRRGPELQAVRLGPGRLPLGLLAAESPCWLTSDPALEREAQRLARKATPERSRPLTLQVEGRLGEPLLLKVLAAPPLAAAALASVVVASSTLLDSARGGGLTRDRLQDQLGRLGGTGWELAELKVCIEGALFLPLGELNRLRRELVEQLANLREQGLTEPALPLNSDPHRFTPQPADSCLPSARSGPLLPLLIRELAPVARPQAQVQPGLVVLVRDLDQLRALREMAVHSVVADFDQPRQLREAVAIGRGCWPGGVWLAGPRVTRPDEAWSLEPLLCSRPDGYLVRNADQLERLTGLAPCVGDFSLNVANPLSLAWFLDHWGLERVCASYDLDLPQLLALLRGTPPGRLEVTVHQHMPLFHMEHCLFCAFLSNGHDHTDCGRPCEQHVVHLRDRSGAEHPLRADLGCRNTLFNARAQSAAEAIPLLIHHGVTHLRLELLDDDASTVRRRVGLYLDVLHGRLTGRALWQREQLENRLGVTRGSLKPPDSSRVRSRYGTA